MSACMTEILVSPDVTVNPLHNREYVWKCKVAFILGFSSSKDAVILILSIRSFERRKGNASEFLGWLCEVADNHGYTLALSPAPFGNYVRPSRLSKRALISWYKRNGFAMNGQQMLRTPKSLIASTAGNAVSCNQ